MTETTHVNEVLPPAASRSPSVLAIHPIICLLRPDQAARFLKRCNTTGFLLAMLLGVMGSIAAITITMLQTFKLRPAVGWWRNADAAPRIVSFSQQWSNWFAGCPSELVLGFWLLMIVLMLVLVFVSAWLLMPCGAEGPNLKTAYRRSLVGVVTGLHFLISLCIVLGPVITSLQHYHVRHQREYNMPSEVLPLLVTMLGIVSLAFLIGIATRGVVRDDPPLDLPPRCEFCGYDLTHVPDSGICTECGSIAADSLTPHIRRTGTDWEHHPSPATFWSTAASVMFNPSKFYGRLQMRRSARAAWWYASLQYLLIGLTAGGMMMATYLITEGNSSSRTNERLFAEAATIGVVLALAFGGIGWLASRATAAITLTALAIRAPLPENGWFRRAMYYEPTYLWLPLIYGMGWLCCFIICEEALNYRFFSQQMLCGAPVMIWIEFIPLTIMAIYWFVRYQKMIAAIRYNNF